MLAGQCICTAVVGSSRHRQAGNLGSHDCLSLLGLTSSRYGNAQSGCGKCALNMAPIHCALPHTHTDRIHRLCQSFIQSTPLLLQRTEAHRFRNAAPNSHLAPCCLGPQLRASVGCPLNIVPSVSRASSYLEIPGKGKAAECRARQVCDKNSAFARGLTIQYCSVGLLPFEQP